MTEVVVARHLSKRYGRTTAVADVSLAVSAGEVVCLLGPNGAGKSTTIRMLATLTRPDGGTARVAGHEITKEPAAVRARIGYVAQNAGTDGYLTGRENLRSQAHAQRIRRADVTVRVSELLEMVGLDDAADRLVNTYSGGMRRRLEIAMGIVHRPQLVVLDEPTTGLDPEARVDLWRELAVLGSRQPMSILLTTHYLDEAEQLADRIVIIDRGRVIIHGTPTDLKAALGPDSTLNDVYFHHTGRRSAVGEVDQLSSAVIS